MYDPSSATMTVLHKDNGAASTASTIDKVEVENFVIVDDFSYEPIT